MKKHRYPLIDLMRFCAISLMVFFHLFYDLDLFGFVDIDFKRDVFWKALPKLIVTLFMLCVGSGVYLSHHKGMEWKKAAKRFGKLALCAGLVSAVTLYAFPSRWVYFGTLHCIALSGLMALPFVKKTHHRPWGRTGPSRGLLGL